MDFIKRFFVFNILVLFFLIGSFTQISRAQNNLAAVNFNLLSSKSSINKGLTRPRIFNRELAAGNNFADNNGAKKPVTVFDLERKAFALLNFQRKIQGLPALEWSEDLAQIARIHSEDMANKNYFSHVSSDGSQVNKRADQLGVRHWRAIGENIAYNRGFANPIEFAVERWMQSPSHKQNLLSGQWKESGVGIAVTKDGTYYFTQVFILRK